jgi:hypothetical protein
MAAGIGRELSYRESTIVVTRYVIIAGYKNKGDAIPLSRVPQSTQYSADLSFGLVRFGAMLREVAAYDQKSGFVVV